MRTPSSTSVTVINAIKFSIGEIEASDQYLDHTGSRVTRFGIRSRAHILTVTLRFSPSFGSSPVNLALANSKAAIAVLAGPSHNSAVRGSTNSRHTSGSVGPPGHHTSSVFRQTTSVLAASRMTLARPVIDRYALSFGSMKA